MLFDRIAAIRQYSCMALYHGYVSPQARGTIALPALLRRRYHLDRDGAQIEVTEREDGVLELRPMVPVPADQAWFWAEEWQRGEREADEQIAAGRTTVHESTVDFLEHLRRLMPPDER